MTNKEPAQTYFLLLLFILVFSSSVKANATPPQSNDQKVNAAAASDTGKDNIAEEKFPSILSPEPGSTISQSSVEFKWEDDPEVTEHWLYVGTTIGGKEIYTNRHEKEQSVSVRDIPQNGGPVYVRLWSKLKDQWGYRDFMYETSQTEETLSINMNPANGEYLRSSSVDFSWDAIPGATEYWLYVGTTPEGKEIYTESQKTNTSVTVNLIPIDGALIYVQLWYKKNDQWDSQKFIYSTDEIKGHQAEQALTQRQWMVTPADGSVLRESKVNFNWGPVPAATSYSLVVETKKGTENIYSHEFGPEVTSAQAGRIPPNVPYVYVQLGAKVDEQWNYQRYVYQTRRADMYIAQMVSPEPGTTLKDSRIAFMWSGGNNVKRGWLTIGTDRGRKDIFSEMQGDNHFALVDGLPLDGKVVFVRLWSEIDGIWFYEDYTYGTEQKNLEAAKLNNFFPNTILSEPTMDFEWDPVFSAREYSFHVGSEKGGKDIDMHDALTLPRATVNNLPLDGRTVYARLWTRSGDRLTFRDYEYKTKKFPVIPAKITNIMNTSGSGQKTLSINWDEGESILEYRLDVGTQLGKKDIARLEKGTDTYAVVPGLGEDQEQIYLRLWSKVYEGWVFKDYLYKMNSPKGELVELAQQQEKEGKDPVLMSPFSED